MGPAMYAIDYYAYEFQSLIEHHVDTNPIYEIRDSIFLTFLDRKIESVERCTKEGECMDATYKPGAMIQVIYIYDKYNYYTLNLSSGWGITSTLTIDGKSYVPDKELQDIIVEIVKFHEISKQVISAEKLHAIINGEKIECPLWPFLPCL